MDTSPHIQNITLKYTLDKSDDIALNCDHWTSTDFAGAIDSGLLQYRGYAQRGNTQNYDTSGNTVTVFIDIDVSNDNQSLEAEDFRIAIADAFQLGHADIEVKLNHTVNIKINGVIKMS